MDDRTMLELAAKAAGVERSAGGDLWSNARGNLWAPLTDDGDAFRLAADLQLDILHRSGVVYVDNPNMRFPIAKEPHGQDKYAAARRATVRAAAEIGKAKEKT